jgi:hypothetical protein
MNNERRKKLKWLGAQIDELAVLVEEIRDAEQEAFDNMPESLQDGERGDAAQQSIDYLDTAIDYLATAVAEMESAAE